MKYGRAGRAREREQVRIAGAVRTGSALLGDVAAHRRLTHDPAQQLHSGHHRVAVVAGSTDSAAGSPAARSRIRRLDAHEAAALRPQLADRRDEARERMQGGAGGVGAENDEVHLDVGRGSHRAGAEEAAGITGADGEQPLSEQDVAQSGADAMTPVVDHVVHRDRLGAAILHADLKMVLQVGADARHVGDHVDAERAQQRAPARAPRAAGAAAS